MKPVAGERGIYEARNLSVFGTALFSRRGAIPWVVLAIGLLLTWLVTHNLSNQRERAADRQFLQHARELVSEVEKRLVDHEHILLGGAGLFDAVGMVSREQWRAYVTRLKLPETYPGIQGVGFSQVIRPEDLDAHAAALRAEGFVDYALRPAGARALYTSTIYLEPFEGRNLAALGYDMYSEPVRREAMHRAVADNRTMISGKVRLVQETHGREQAGILMYVPVYRPDMPTDTEEARWQALLGFVYSPYRMDDLMRGILGAQHPYLHLQLFDGATMHPEYLLHGSGDTRSAATHTPAHSATHHIEAYGRTWSLSIHSRAAFEAGFRDPLDWLAPALGSGISLSLFALLWLLLGHRERAMELAREMAAGRAESEERFLHLFLNMGQGVLIHAEDGRIAEANPAAARILGVERSALLGDTDVLRGWETIHENGTAFPAEDHPVRRVPQETGQSITDVVMGIRQTDDEPWRWIKIDTYVWQGSESHPKRRIYEVFTDITEQKRTERLKREFVSTVSHELRTPLTSISGSLGMIGSGALGTLPENIRQLVDIALKNSKRLSQLINDLLDIEKISAGKLHFDLQWQPLRPLIMQAIESIQPYAVEHGVKLRLDGVQEDSRVCVDSQRLEQVMANLLSNAIKFSNAGSGVEVAVRTHEGRTRVSVTDHGCGIPDEFRSSIFQKFSQADASDRRKRGGTGLGLAITRELVERMGGRIGFDSQPGHGSVFWVDFPSRPGTNEPEAANRMAFGAHAGSHTYLALSGGAQLQVLYVEDDEDLQRVVPAMTGNQCAFTAARDLAEARDMLARHRYDVIMFDIDLPDGSAWDLMPLMRERQPQARTVILSGTTIGAREASQIDAVLLKSTVSAQDIREALDLPEPIPRQETNPS